MSGESKDSDVTVLPDGSAFGTWSMPLPRDHWLYKGHAEGELHEAPTMGLRIGTDDPRREVLRQHIWDAGKYAVRAATMRGTEEDFDPDALVQALVVGLLGYHTKDGLSDDEWDNPSPVPKGFDDV